MDLELSQNAGRTEVKNNPHYFKTRCLYYRIVQDRVFSACDPRFESHPLFCVAQCKYSLFASSLSSCLFIKGRTSHLKCSMLKGDVLL